MTLFSVAKQNMKGNFKNYLIYFISMTFSVVIYYIFVSLEYSREIAEELQSSQSLQTVFSQASVILILFMAVFIWSSNAFFTRKRKKEIGLYALLGMRKKTIARMLFYENLMMSTAALLLGTVIGTLLSKLFTMILLKLLDTPIHIRFGISLQAIGKVTLVFAVLIIITSVQGYRLIYKFKLVELFQADQKGEHAPKISATAAIVSVLLLSFGYCIAFLPMATNEETARNLVLLSACLLAGTYLFFRSAIIAILKIAASQKKHYYHGINMVGTSHLLYRCRSNTIMLTTIALLSSLTLCAASVGYSSFYMQKSSADKEAPFSYMYISKNPASDSRIRDIILADKEHPLKAEIDIPVLKTTGDLTRFFYRPGSYDPQNVPITLIPAAVYNKASKALNWNGSVQLSGSDAAVIRPMYTSFTVNEIKGNQMSITTKGVSSVLRMTKIIEDRIVPWGYPDISIVISDKLFNQLSGGIAPLTYKAYKVENQETTKKTAAALMEIQAGQSAMSTFYNQYRQNVESSGVNVFTLGFLGLVFLAATGSIIYFKQLTEAESDKHSYAILRKVGVSSRDIRFSIAKQLLFVFALPLAVGILHSIVMLKALVNINLIDGSFAVPILASGVSYMLIYLAYYAFTVKSYQRIVGC